MLVSDYQGSRQSPLEGNADGMSWHLTEIPTSVVSHDQIQKSSTERRVLKNRNDLLCVEEPTIGAMFSKFGDLQMRLDYVEPNIVSSRNTNISHQQVNTKMRVFLSLSHIVEHPDSVRVFMKYYSLPSLCYHRCLQDNIAIHENDSFAKVNLY